MTICHMHQATHHLGAANPYALSSILQASDHSPIVASEDICDERGTKLWARDQPVSAALQQRLLDRKLRQPLEACLRAPEGVSSADLVQTVRRTFDETGPLSLALRPWARELVGEVERLPLHPVAQLMLTAMRGSQPAAFDHAIQAMLLAGAMYMHAGSDRYELRLALLAGLLHDVGELYVNPALLAADAELTPAGFRHIVVHPRIGELLLARLTDHPRELARAVGEHHERGTGMGYPLRARYLSWLGCRLSAVETLMGVLADHATAAHPHHGAAWEHGSLALRLVPGEFDPVAIAFASQVARRVRSHAGLAAPAATAALDGAAVWERSQQLSRHIEASTQAAQSLSACTPPGRVRESATLAAELLAQLAHAGRELGLWARRELLGEQLGELDIANREIAHRVQDIQRISTWLDPDMHADEEAALARLWGPHASAEAHANTSAAWPLAAPAEACPPLPDPVVASEAAQAAA
ncbi:HD-GYP domain-containing protein [Aquabacterium sp.]|uniref:HD-GYP domain-containing protein n=1 Tax=Aquabacterium sp. TaxID=1872578 RepID=UPI0035C7548E